MIGNFGATLGSAFFRQVGSDCSSETDDEFSILSVWIATFDHMPGNVRGIAPYLGYCLIERRREQSTSVREDRVKRASRRATAVGQWAGGTRNKTVAGSEAMPRRN